MVREFKLPDVGEGVAEGELVSWLVEEGDTVSEDQPVAEVETDKALVEVPSPVNGTVRELRAEEGEVVPVGEVIITFDVEGEESEASRASEQSEAPRASDEGEGKEPKGAAEQTESQTERSSEPAGIDEPETDDAEGEAGPGPESESDSAGSPGAIGAEADEPATSEGRVFAPPRVRRLARAEGIDIATLEGSGPGGRITEADVYAATESSGDEAAASGATESETGESPSPATDVGAATGVTRGTEDSPADPTPDVDGDLDLESADRDRTLAAPATRRIAREEGVDLNAVPTDEVRDGEAFVTPEAVREYAQAQRAAQEADAAAVSARAEGDDIEAEAEAEAEARAGSRAPQEREERVPYRGVRKAIGDQMERSKYTAPHVTHFDEVDVTDLVETRTRLKERASEQGIRLTYMPFVMKAVAAALTEYPLFNSQLDEENEEIVKLGYYNIGVATATDAGLMVPVVENVDQKGMLQLASEMNELIQKAQDRSISLEEMQGGTFTVTNVGGIGGRFATPIINYPEVAILALGSIEERPRVVDGEVVPRHVLPLSLSFDHRVVDGAIAARFTNTLAEYLRDPELLLLE